MSEAPERIWLDNLRTSGGETFGVCGVRAHVNGGQEYIRADLVEAAVKRAIEACAEAFGKHPSIQIETYAHHMSWRHNVQRSIRAIAQDPDAIAKIVEGR